MDPVLTLGEKLESNKNSTQAKAQQKLVAAIASAGLAAVSKGEGSFTYVPHDGEYTTYKHLAYAMADVGCRGLVASRDAMLKSDVKWVVAMGEWLKAEKLGMALHDEEAFLCYLP